MWHSSYAENMYPPAHPDASLKIKEHWIPSYFLFQMQ